MDCFKCATPIPDDSRFCLNCGADVSGETGVQEFGLTSEEMDELLRLLRKETEGEFVVEKELGRGGMAAVFLAREVALQRQVAIKVLPPEMTYGKSMVERFIREARTAAALDHPNIIPIYRVSSSEGKLFWYAMKFVEGTDLASVLKGKNTLPVGRTLAVLEPVARALEFAHGRNVIHRDVKPANVMLGNDDWIYVTDFGIAKALGASSLTGSGGMIGTPFYMAPEQCRGGRTVTAAADQYALAVMTYQMLAGEVPFDGDSAIDIITQHVMSPPPPLEKARPDLPRQLCRVVLRGMAKNPVDRYRSTTEFVRALREGSAGASAVDVGQRTTVRTAEAALRAVRAVRKSRVRSWMVLAGALAVVGIAGALWWPQLRGSVETEGPPVESPATQDDWGILRVPTSPSDALVTVNDSVMQGDSMRVALGMATVRVSAPGYRDTAFSVRLQRPGGTVERFVALAMQAPERVAAEPASRQAPEAAQQSPTPVVTLPAPVRADSGFLRINSIPREATVYLDGVRIGTTRIVDFRTAVGEHELRFELAGYRSLDTTVTVAREERATVAVTLIGGGQ